jgi:chromosome partitioning protein
MLMTARHLPKPATYRAFISIVPPHPSREGETMREDLREAGIPVFDSLIRRTTAFAKAALQGKTVRDIHTPQAAAAWSDYASLGKEVLEIMK